MTRGADATAAFLGGLAAAGLVVGVLAWTKGRELQQRGALLESGLGQQGLGLAAMLALRGGGIQAEFRNPLSPIRQVAAATASVVGEQEAARTLATAYGFDAATITSLSRLRLLGG